MEIVFTISFLLLLKCMFPWLQMVFGGVDNIFRPVINGFVLRQHLSVQLILKIMDRNTKLRATSGTMNIHQQISFASLWLSEV